MSQENFMKSLIVALTLLASMPSFASEANICEAVPSYDLEKCEKLVANKKLEQIPVELCQYRVTKGAILECYEAIANRTYEYDEVLLCARLHHYDIPACMEGSGSPIDQE